MMSARVCHKDTLIKFIKQKLRTSACDRYTGRGGVSTMFFSGKTPKLIIPHTFHIKISKQKSSLARIAGIPKVMKSLEEHPLLPTLDITVEKYLKEYIGKYFSPL